MRGGGGVGELFLGFFASVSPSTIKSNIKIVRMPLICHSKEKRRNLQTIYGKPNSSPNQRSTDSSRNDRSSESASLLERRSIYMEEKNERGHISMLVFLCKWGGCNRQVGRRGRFANKTRAK